MSGYELDALELYRRLDACRHERGISWRAIGRETRLSPCVFTRLGQGRAPDAHALLTLLVWLDLDADIAFAIKPREQQ
ncbi:MAG: hypothetical protein LBV60_08555 [Streptomyces sp.]|nr:hypothetical protein [Streptomyces sp.]